LKSFLNDTKKRSLLFQVASLIVVVSIIYYLYYNTQANLQRQNIATGFGFLSNESSFEVSESVIPFSSEDTYLKALFVGFLGTLKVAIIGNIIAVILGVIIGISRKSNNYLISKLSSCYIELLRNIPLLLQLFFWYSLFTEIFPSVRNAYSPFPNVFLSNRGAIIPTLSRLNEYTIFFVGLAITAILFIIANIKLKKIKLNTGNKFIYSTQIYVSILLIPFIFWFLSGRPTYIDVPVLKGFNFRGGYTLSPEFLSLLFGLVLYTAAFIAEIVRAGIESVTKGQWEAAESLGLNKFQTLRFVILPQAFRVIIPPLTSQILNLTKNSSLAVAIAYPDYVSIANTVMNQTGQAIELVGSIMIVYLTLSLSMSFFMNWYNKKITLVGKK